MSKLHKSNKDRMLFGVCGGLSKSLSLDPTILRLGFALGAVFSGSILLWIYILLSMILPTQED
jgi:phage shock protein PspC (stress-responsive transcriptional regulator)